MKPWDVVNLSLAALAAVLLALYYWPQDDGVIPLTALDPQTIDRVRIERGARLTLALQRAGDDWQLVHPDAMPAESRRVGQLLAIMRAPVRHSFAAPTDLAPYGLDSPQAILQLDDLRLQFGGREPSQDGRYVLGDGRIKVIDDVYFNLLTLPATHFARD